MHRIDVEFPAEDGLMLRGWLYLPENLKTPAAAISMAHGYAGTRYHNLARFAERFAEAGFVVLLHDHRNFGGSDSVERGDIDPWRQIADWRHAISFLERREEVDPNRLGVWGTSFAGGHVLVLGATDRRLRAVVSQVPTISGYLQGLRRNPPEAIEAVWLAFAADDRTRALGKPGARIKVVSADMSAPAAYYASDAVDFYLRDLPEGVWENEVTLRSARAARTYEPGAWAPRISPTPLLMIVATHDTITPTDLSLRAFEDALQPKALALIPGGHFDPYLDQFEAASSAAESWFLQHLT